MSIYCTYTWHLEKKNWDLEKKEVIWQYIQMHFLVKMNVIAEDHVQNNKTYSDIKEKYDELTLWEITFLYMGQMTSVSQLFKKKIKTCKIHIFFTK